MIRNAMLNCQFVDFIPERLSEGYLYISKRYRTASHLCCCGCKLEVVTPLNPAKWRLTEHPDGTVSLTPSIGNWSFPCQSHYFVTRSRIEWAGAFSLREIAAVQSRDRHDALLLEQASQARGITLGEILRRAWGKLVAVVNAWFR
jgi:hypothetical protein